MPYQTVTSVPMADSEIMKEDMRGRSYPGGAVIDVWHAPDGWPLRRIRVPGADGGKRGALLFLAGRADPLEKYVESLGYWADHGWNVESMDWRGQAGSGRFPPGPVNDFALRVGDLAAYVAEWSRGHGPHVVIAHSMGGFLALQAMVTAAIAPDAAVLVAPMLGLNNRPLPNGFAHAIARMMSRLGFGDRTVWAKAEVPGVEPSAHQRRLTHDLRRYADKRWWRVERPELSTGAPTWRWLAGAYEATGTLSASPKVETTYVPTLILAAGSDRLVSVDAINRIAARLPDAQLHIYGPTVAHEILREVDAVRDDALARIDAFLDECAPAHD